MLSLVERRVGRGHAESGGDGGGVCGHGRVDFDSETGARSGWAKEGRPKPPRGLSAIADQVQSHRLRHSLALPP